MADENHVKVWDTAIRVFHWSLVIFFVVAWLTGDEENDLHALAGYFILGLLGFRLLWGVIGTRHARFWNFIYGPGTTLAYLRALLDGHPPLHLGHNPLGGWMVVALLCSLSLSVWSGLEAYAAEGKGPLAMSVQVIAPVHARDATARREHQRGEREHEVEGYWKEVHELCVNVTLVLVFLHIGGVLLSSYIERENLVRAMLTGYKNRPREDLP